MKKCAVLPKQLRRVSGAEVLMKFPMTAFEKKQLRRVSGAEDDWMVDRDELLGNNSEE